MTEAPDTDLFGGPIIDRPGFSHETPPTPAGTDEWLTPLEVLHPLGPFDLDPCAPADHRRPWDTARHHYSIADDGLRGAWFGRVWLNPPYSTAKRWLARMADHDHGTLLIFARTDTAMWHEHVWPKATGILFVRGRIRFCYPSGVQQDSNSGAPSALVGYGEQDAGVLSRLPLPGHYVRLRP